MKIIALSMVLFAAAGCGRQQAPKASINGSSEASPTAPVRGPFSSQELQKFVAFDPIDTHTHVYRSTPAFYAMLKKLNLHILDIMLVDDTDPELKNLTKEAKDAWSVVHGSDGYVALCTTFDQYRFSQPDFDREAIRKLNQDFSQGAVAVKFYKNVGMEIKDAKGNYIMPDNPVFEPIFKDIAAHHKTLIAHLADPDSSWEAPNPASPDYEYYLQHPGEYMYKIPGAPTKAKILRARDYLLKENPDLRMVGAHLGSMESNFDQLGQHLDQYPNFAVDLAARMPYFEMQPRAKIIAFITKYQDRLIYGTDNEFYSESPDTVEDWENTYANDWRYLATNDTILYKTQKVEGLALPEPILRKIYHDNAVKWFPGILESSHR